MRIYTGGYEMKNVFCNKGICIVIVSLIIGLAFTPIAVSQVDKVHDNTTERGLFTLEADIKVTYNAKELSEKIPPLGGYNLVHINVSYKVRGMFATALLPIIKRKWSSMPIKLSLEDVPEWADILIVPDIVYPEFDTQWSTKEAFLFISVQDSMAPANVPNIIQLCLEPEYEYLHGPLGIIPLLHSSNRTAELAFTVDYYPLISVTPENDTIETPPGQQVTLPISIKNLGNAETVVTIDKLEYPDDWHVYIVHNVKVDINEEIQVSLSLVSPKNFSGNQTIRLAFTPSYFAWPEDKGVTQFISVLAHYKS